MRSIFTVIFFFLAIQLFSHSKSKYHIIIDTDGGQDDLRAISYVLANPDFETLAIVSSDGVLSPEETILKVQNLLSDFHHEGIALGVGEKSMKKEPVFREFATQMRWGDKTKTIYRPVIKANECISNTIRNEEFQIIYLSLGSLENLKNLLINNPEIEHKIKEVVWFCGDKKIEKSFNYKANKKAAKFVLNNYNNLKIIRNTDLFFTKESISILEHATSRYGKKVFQNIQFVEKSGHSKNIYLWDELTALYLSYPEEFEKSAEDKSLVFTPKEKNTLIQKLCEVLYIESSDNMIVYSKIPLSDNYYKKDVNSIKNSTIEKFGLNEWKLICFTNEFHEHLGVYSIVGAKMGVRARDFFDIGIDEFMIVSFAGTSPPISCLNDGLQMSTGSTLGHGTIRVESTEISRPKATFYFKDQALTLELKKELWKDIKRNVTKAIGDVGFNSPEYWEIIRRNALNVWENWDRNEIFEVRLSENYD